MTVSFGRCVTNKAVTGYYNWQLTSPLTGLSTTSWKWTVTSPRSYWSTLQRTALPFPVSIIMQGTDIQRVSSTKLLGVIKSSDLSWKEHLNCIHSNAARRRYTFSPCWSGLGCHLTVWQRYTQALLGPSWSMSVRCGTSSQRPWEVCKSGQWWQFSLIFLMVML